MNKKPVPVAVILSEDERQVALQVWGMRHVFYEKAVGMPADVLQQHAYRESAEIAACKALNIYPDVNRSTLRARVFSHNHSRIRIVWAEFPQPEYKAEGSEDVFLVITGTFGVHEIHGYILRKNISGPTFRHDALQSLEGMIYPEIINEHRRKVGA